MIIGSQHPRVYYGRTPRSYSVRKPGRWNRQHVSHNACPVFFVSKEKGTTADGALTIQYGSNYLSHLLALAVSLFINQVFDFSRVIMCAFTDHLERV